MPTKIKSSASVKKVSRATKSRGPLRKAMKVELESLQSAPEPWYYELKQAPDTSANPADSPSLGLPSASLKTESRRGRWGWQNMFLFAAIIVFPLFALPWALETHEFAKQILLSVLVGLGLLLVFGISARRGLFSFLPRHAFLLLGILSLVAALVSTLKSNLRYSSFFGYGGQESLAFTSLLLIGLWVLIVFTLAKQSGNRALYFALALSASLTSLITILALFGLHFYPWIKASGWNPAGTTAGASIIAAVGIVLGSGLILRSKNWTSYLISVLLILPSLILLLGTDFTASWMVLAFGLGALVLFYAKESLGNYNSLWRSLPFILVLLALALFQSILPLKTDFLSTPLEVGPSHQETWSIVRQTLHDEPVFGSGPASFGAEYLKYRSAPILQTAFWNVVFDWGSSGALTLFGNLGFAGGALLFMTVLSVILSYGWRVLCKSGEEAPDRMLSIALFSTGVVLFVGAWLVPISMSLVFFLGTVLGIMLAQKTEPIESRRSIAVSMGGAAFLLFVFLLLFVQGRRAVAEFFVVSAATKTDISLEAAQALLSRAQKLDPWNDAYARMTADTQRLILRARLARAALQNTGEMSAEDLRRATDETIQVARRVAELAPGAVINWAGLGALYLDIAPFTSGAAQAALEAFNKARNLSPNDPALLVNIGIAQSLIAENKTDAEQSLRRAAEIRPDYIFAHLELARLLGQENKTEEALGEYRRAEEIQPNDPALKYEIGLFLLSRDRRQEAQIALEGAVNLAPNFSNARWYLAQIYEEAGAMERAIEEIQKIVEQNSDSQQAEDRLAELQKKLSSE